MLDCQHLAILREVKRSGSVTAAAKQLNVTQSALSHMVRKIEERYGVTLWEKQGRGLRFTQSGLHLVDLAERILPQVEQAERALRDYARGRRGALRVGMECHPCERWLMRLVPHYLADWPDVDFDIRTAFRFDGVEALLAHEIDLLITPDPIEQSDLSFVPVFDYELVLVVHNDHPLSARKWITPIDVVNQTLFTVPVSTERLDIYTRFLLPGQCRPREHRTAETTDLMLELVAANRGVSVLPDWLVREEGAHLPVRTLRLGPGGIRKSITIGVRRGEESTAYVAGFVDLAKEQRR